LSHGVRFLSPDRYRRKDGGGVAAGRIVLLGATLNTTFNTDPVEL